MAIYKIGFSVDAKKVAPELRKLDSEIKKVTEERRVTLETKEALRAAEVLKRAIQAATTSGEKVSFITFEKQLRNAGFSAEKLRATLVKGGMTQSIQSFDKAILNADRTMLSLNKKLKDAQRVMTQAFKYNLAQSVFRNIQGSIQATIGYVRDLDSSFNQIQRVTEKTAAQMDEVYKATDRASRALRVTARDYADASLIFFQQGLDGEAVERRTEITLKAAKVSQIGVKEASEQLTAVWNTYRMSTDQLELAADVAAKLGAETAVDFGYIAEAMQYAALPASQLGIEYEKLASIIATVGETTMQSASTVGNAYKTIFARFADLKAAGEDGVIELGKHAKSLKAMGIDILDVNGELRDMSVVIEEIGGAWDSYSQKQQVAIAQIVGGVRQYGQFIALMQNFDKYQKNLQTTDKAAGSLNKQYKVQLDSIESLMENSKEAWLRAFKDLVASDAQKSFYKMLEKTGKVVENIVKGIGGLKGLLLAIAAIYASKLLPSIMAGARGMKDLIVNSTAEGMRKSVDRTYQAMKPDMRNRQSVIDNVYGLIDMNKVSGKFQGSERDAIDWGAAQLRQEAKWRMMGNFMQNKALGERMMRSPNKKTALEGERIVKDAELALKKLDELDIKYARLIMKAELSIKKMAEVQKGITKNTFDKKSTKQTADALQKLQQALAKLFNEIGKEGADATDAFQDSLKEISAELGEVEGASKETQAAIDRLRNTLDSSEFKVLGDDPSKRGDELREIANGVSAITHSLIEEGDAAAGVVEGIYSSIKVTTEGAAKSAEAFGESIETVGEGQDELEEKFEHSLEALGTSFIEAGGAALFFGSSTVEAFRNLQDGNVGAALTSLMALAAAGTKFFTTFKKIGEWSKAVKALRADYVAALTEVGNASEVSAVKVTGFKAALAGIAPYAAAAVAAITILVSAWKIWEEIENKRIQTSVENAEKAIAELKARRELTKQIEEDTNSLKELTEAYKKGEGTYEEVIKAREKLLETIGDNIKGYDEERLILAELTGDFETLKKEIQSVTEAKNEQNLVMLKATYGDMGLDFKKSFKDLNVLKQDRLLKELFGTKSIIKRGGRRASSKVDLDFESPTGTLESIEKIQEKIYEIYDDLDERDKKAADKVLQIIEKNREGIQKFLGYVKELRMGIGNKILNQIFPEEGVGNIQEATDLVEELTNKLSELDEYKGLSKGKIQEIARELIIGTGKVEEGFIAVIGRLQESGIEGEKLQELLSGVFEKLKDKYSEDIILKIIAKFIFEGTEGKDISEIVDSIVEGATKSAEEIAFRKRVGNLDTIKSLRDLSKKDDLNDEEAAKVKSYLESMDLSVDEIDKFLRDTSSMRIAKLQDMEEQFRVEIKEHTENLRKIFEGEVLAKERELGVLESDIGEDEEYSEESLRRISTLKTEIEIAKNNIEKLNIEIDTYGDNAAHQAEMKLKALREAFAGLSAESLDSKLSGDRLAQIDNYNEKIRENAALIKEYEGVLTEYGYEIQELEGEFASLSRVKQENILRENELALAFLESQKAARELNRVSKDVKAGEYEKAAAQDKYNRTLEDFVKLQGKLSKIDTKEIMRGADAIITAAKAGKGGFGSDLAVDYYAALKVSLKIAEISKGVVTLRKEYEKWIEILKDNNAEPLIKEEAVEGIREALDLMLTGDNSDLSDSFILEYQELIREAMNGDIEALKELDRLAQEFLIKNKITWLEAHKNIKIPEDTKNEIISQYMSLFSQLQNIAAGTDLTPDTIGAIEALGNIMLQAGYTVQQIAAMFEGLGIDAIFEPVSFDADSYISGYTLDKVKGSNQEAQRRIDTGRDPVRLEDDSTVAIKANPTAPVKIPNKYAAANLKFKVRGGAGFTGTKTSPAIGTGGMSRANSVAPVGGGSSGGRSKTSKDPNRKTDPARMEKLDETHERYRNLTDAIKVLTKVMDKYNQAEDNAVGRNKIMLMKEKEKIYRRQALVYKDLLAEAKKHYEYDKENLAKEAKRMKADHLIEYAEDGTLMHREGWQKFRDEAVQPYIDKVNSLRKALEGMSGEAAEAMQDALKTAEKALEDKREEFEELNTLLDRVDESANKQYEYILKGAEMFREAIRLKIAEVDYAAELRLVVKEFDLKTVEQAMLGLSEEAAEFFIDSIVGKSNKLDIALKDQKSRMLEYERIKEIGYNIDRARIGDEHWFTDKFGKDAWLKFQETGRLDKAFYDEANKYAEEAMETNKQYHELAQQVWESYGKALDLWISKINRGMENIDANTQKLEGMIQLFEKTQTWTGAKDLEQFYKKIKVKDDKGITRYEDQVDRWKQSNENWKMYEHSLESLRAKLDVSITQRDLLKKGFKDYTELYKIAVQTHGADSKYAVDLKNKLAELQVQIKEAEAGLVDQVNGFLDKARQAAEIQVGYIREAFARRMKGIFADFAQAGEMYGQHHDMTHFWMNPEDLAFEISELKKELDKEMEGVTEPKLLKEYQEFLNKVNTLKDSGQKITEREFEILKAEFDLTKAKARFEDARNAKTAMRLARDSSGNWSYIYSSNGDRSKDSAESVERKMHNIKKMQRQLMEETSANWHQMHLDMVEFEATVDQRRYAQDEAYKNAIDKRRSWFKTQLDDHATVIERMNIKLGDIFKETTLGVITETQAMKDLNDKYKLAHDQFVEDLADNYAYWENAAKGAMGAIGFKYEELRSKAIDETERLKNANETVSLSVQAMEIEANKNLDSMRGKIEGFAQRWREEIRSMIDYNIRFYKSVQLMNQNLHRDATEEAVSMRKVDEYFKLFAPYGGYTTDYTGLAMKMLEKRKINPQTGEEEVEYKKISDLSNGELAQFKKYAELAFYKIGLASHYQNDLLENDRLSELVVYKKDGTIDEKATREARKKYVRSVAENWDRDGGKYFMTDEGFQNWFVERFLPNGFSELQGSYKPKAPGYNSDYKEAVDVLGPGAIGGNQDGTGIIDSLLMAIQNPNVPIIEGRQPDYTWPDEYKGMRNDLREYQNSILKAIEKPSKVENHFPNATNADEVLKKFKESIDSGKLIY